MKERDSIFDPQDVGLKVGAQGRETRLVKEPIMGMTAKAKARGNRRPKGQGYSHPSVIKREVSWGHA